MNRESLSRVRVVLTALLILCILGESARIQAAGPTAPSYVPGEILIGYRTAPDIKSLAASNPDLARAFSDAGVQSVEPLFDGSPFSAKQSAALPAVHRLVLAKDRDVFAVARELSKLPGVRYAEPNYLGGAAYTPTSDPLYTQQAGDLAIINMEDGWQAQIDSTGSPGADPSVLVAIIDSGAELEHLDLLSIDTDNSYNFVDDNQVIFDDQGHGTRVAGIIGAAAGNDEGIAGVAFGSTLLILDVMDSSGAASIAEVAEAVRYATTQGAAVINLSLGYTVFSQTLMDACDDAAAAGVLVVASAGNNNQGELPFYPAAFASVMGVGAVADDGEMRATYSNYNDRQANLVDIVAPGSTVFSTVPGSQYNGSYGSGTSFSAPIVSGVAALMKTVYPNQSGAAIRAHLLSNATALPGFLPAGGAGAGLLDADAALSNPMSPALSIDKIVVDDDTSYDPDNDNDGVLDAGETARLVVTVATAGADVLNASATISTADPDIGAIATDTASLGNILVGTPAGNAAQPFADVVVSPSAGVKTVDFALDLSADDGVGDTLNLSLVVEDEIDIAGVFNDFSFENTNTYHVTGSLILNGDTTIEPGTTIKVDPQRTIRVASGTLDANGTPQSPITFTSARPANDFVEGDLAPALNIGPRTEPVDLNDPTALYLYVDPNTGSDETGDGTPGNPYATLQKPNSLPLGDASKKVIIAAEGVYTGTGPVVIKVEFHTWMMGGHQSGTWVRDVFKYPSIIDGENQRDGVYTTRFSRFDGFRVQNSKEYAIPSPVNYVEFVISNNWFDGDCAILGITGTSTRNNVFLGSVALDYSELGNDFKKNIVNVGLRVNQLAEIDSNVVLRSALYGIELVDQPSDVSILNNILAYNTGSGIHIPSGASGIEIINNTILSNAGLGISSESTIPVINNILWDNEAGQLATPAGSTVLSNVIEGGFIGGSGTIEADPQVVTLLARGNCLSAAYAALEGVTIIQTSNSDLPPYTMRGAILVIGGHPYYIMDNESDSITIFGRLDESTDLPQFWRIESYRIPSSDSSAVGAGTGPSADARVPSDDIDGEVRSGAATDIGADLFNPATAPPEERHYWDRLEIADGVTSVTLSNVIVENARGVLVSDADTIINDVTVQGNAQFGIKAEVPLNAPVSGLIAENNVGIGIDLPGTDLTGGEAVANGGTGIIAESVSTSLASRNAGNGIEATTATNSEASGNSNKGFLLTSGGSDLLAELNIDEGIVTSGGDITDCQAFDNGDTGITISGGGTISGSTASSNAGDGISTDGSTIDECTVEYNAGTGIVGSGSSTVTDSRIVENATAAVSGVTTIMGTAIARNGAGVSNATTVSGTSIGQNAGNGITGSGSIADSSIFANDGAGIHTFSTLDNSWVVRNDDEGLRSDGATGTATDSSILGNAGYGTRNILSLTGSNIYGNSPYEAFDDDTSSSTDRDFTGNWWGADHTPEIIANENNGNFSFIHDFLDSSGNHLIDILPAETSEVSSAPDTAPPAFLLSVTPEPDEPITIVGPVDFTLVFSEPMDTSVDPGVTFDTLAPYTEHVVAPSPGWIDSTTWQGTFWMQSDTGDGTNVIRVSGATEANGFVLPDDTSHSFILDTGGPGVANNGLASGGTTTMTINWDPYPFKSSILGYNVHRSDSGEVGTFKKVNSDYILGTTYVDRGLLPNTTYYYMVFYVDLDGESNQWTDIFEGTTGDGWAGEVWTIR